jgi:hypothetical protein
LPNENLPDVLVYPTVESAAKTLEAGRIDWLFIRINQWDEYQHVVAKRKTPTHRPYQQGPANQPQQTDQNVDQYGHENKIQGTRPHTVFLSGHAEKCTDHLDTVLDAHLQPPYRASRLAKIWNRLSDRDFTPRPLDFFFLKTHARYIPIRYSDLCQVQTFGRELWIETRHTEYRITTSLAAFQARLPIPLARVRRGWLVNEAYDPDPPQPTTKPFFRPTSSNNYPRH